MKKDSISGFPIVTYNVLLPKSQEGIEANVKTVFGFGVVKRISAFVLVDLDAGRRRSNARKMLA